jgi:hypothetical protein
LPATRSPATPDETIEMTIVKHNGALTGFTQWTLDSNSHFEFSCCRGWRGDF